MTAIITLQHSGVGIPKERPQIRQDRIRRVPCKVFCAGPMFLFGSGFEYE